MRTTEVNVGSVNTIARTRPVTDDEYLIILKKEARHPRPSILLEAVEPPTSSEVRIMFDPSSMNKVFCSCGAIEEIDSDVVGLKHELGKEVECRVCRNRRISRDLEEFNERFGGEQEEFLYS